MRVAVISLHASPLSQPGEGDSGGMNVFIRSVWQRLADRHIEADAFTRRERPAVPEVAPMAPGVRLIRVDAGPPLRVPKESLPELVPWFSEALLRSAATIRGASPYTLVHAHYWLSGMAGVRAARRWGVPLVVSFHTLARVKNAALAPSDRPEPSVRIQGEEMVIEAADRIIVPSAEERDNLLAFYGAKPDRISIVPPGVDTSIFHLRPRPTRRLERAPLFLYVGRLLKSKGIDTAVRAFNEAALRDPGLMKHATLLIVGGPRADRTGRTEGSERHWILEEARRAGRRRIVFLPAQSHRRLARLYGRASAVLMPSRSESFGLVALEAGACGAPVVAAAVGGLRSVVRDGVTGFLVEGHDPSSYADRILWIAANPEGANRLSLAAAEHARLRTWETSACRLHDVYREVVDEHEVATGRVDPAPVL